MTDPTIILTDDPSGALVAQIGPHRFRLERGRAETVLTRLFTALRAGLDSHSGFAAHFADHQITVDWTCTLCKFEGRVLASQARTRVQDSRYAPKAPTPGRPFLAVIAELMAREESRRASARESAPRHAQSTSLRAEDLL